LALVLTLVHTKQIRINIHKRNNKKHSTYNTKHSIHMYIYYQNIHTIVKKNPHTLTHTLQNNHSTRYTPNEIVTVQASTLSVRSP